jgi:hypothetical protein
MHRPFIYSGRRPWLQGLGMLILCGLSPIEAQNTIGVPGPGEADPLDAFGAAPNVTICPPGKPFRCEAGNCVTNPTRCEAVRPCPEDSPLRCSDGRCVSSGRDCGYGILSPRDRR